MPTGYYGYKLRRAAALRDAVAVSTALAAEPLTPIEHRWRGAHERYQNVTAPKVRLLWPRLATAATFRDVDASAVVRLHERLQGYWEPELAAQLERALDRWEAKQKL